MPKCEICSKQFDYDKGFSGHVKRCTKSRDFIVQNDLSKEKVEKIYAELGSVLEFAKRFNIANGFAYKLFKFLDVKRSIKQASNAEVVKNRRKKTNFEKYGCEHNFSKQHPSRTKWENELFEKEGITNVFQRESVKKKSIDTIIKRYGSKLDLGKRFQKGSAISSLNKSLYEILDGLNIDYDAEFPIKNPSVGKYMYIFDVRIGDLLIEANGDYWHGNPILYKPNDIILKGTTGETTVKEKWSQDKLKIQIAEKSGYTVLVVWEYELINDLDNTKRKIYEAIKNQKHKQN